MRYIYKDNELQAINEDGNKVGYATIKNIDENTINILRVFIDPSLRGSGEASKLMEEVYNFAVEREYRVKNTCPYAVAWFKRKKEKQHILAEEQPDEACLI